MQWQISHLLASWARPGFLIGYVDLKCLVFIDRVHMAMGQNQWYHFGVGAPPILDHFSLF